MVKIEQEMHEGEVRRVNNRRISFHDRPDSLPTVKAKGKLIRLKNRRMYCAKIDKGYSFIFKSLTDDRKVSTLSFALTEEAALLLPCLIEAVRADESEGNL